MRPLDVLRSWAVQDSPPGAAIARRRRARAGDAGGLARTRRTVVALYNPRTATAVVPADEVAAYGTALLPADDQGLKAIVGSRAARPTTRASRSRSSSPSTRSRTRWTARELSRDDLHEQLRKRLPGELLPWCEGCQSHHARRGLLMMAGAQRAAVHLRPGRAPARVLAHGPALGWDAPPREEAGRGARAPLPPHLRRTSTSAHFADGPASAARTRSELWELGRRRRAGAARALERRAAARPRRPGPARPRPRGAAARPGGAQEGVGGARRDGDRARRRRAGRAVARAQEGQEARGVRRGAAKRLPKREIETAARAARPAPRLHVGRRAFP